MFIPPGLAEWQRDFSERTRNTPDSGLPGRGAESDFFEQLDIYEIATLLVERHGWADRGRRRGVRLTRNTATEPRHSAHDILADAFGRPFETLKSTYRRYKISPCGPSMSSFGEDVPEGDPPWDIRMSFVEGDPIGPGAGR